MDRRMAVPVTSPVDAERAAIIAIIDVHGNIASAVVDSDVYREYLHLVETDDGWKIVNALWHST